MSLYYIAIIIPEPLQSEITAFKNDIYERFGAKSALKSPAHITLFPPFNWKNEDETALKTTLDGFSSSIFQENRPLSIKLKNFGFFRKSTIFIQPESNENGSILRGSLLDYLSTHIGLRDDKDAERPFHPHITIVNRDITEADFEEIWAEYAHKSFENQFIAGGISLLRYNDGRWDVVHIAAF